MEWLDLFAGAGGGSIGIERAGGSVSMKVEILDAAQRVQKLRYPQVPLVPDIQDVLVAADDCEPCPDGCDEPFCARHQQHFHECACLGVMQDEAAPAFTRCVLGGFPCQDISAGRDRWKAEDRGLDGSRSGLWWEYHRILERTGAEWAVVENVERLRTGRSGADYMAIIEALGALGYRGFSVQLDALAFGLPARRPRIYIIARRGGHPVELAARFINEFDHGYVGAPGRQPEGGRWSGPGWVHAWWPGAPGQYQPRKAAVVNLAGDGWLEEPRGPLAIFNKGKGWSTVDYATTLDASYFKGPDNHGQRTAVILDPSVLGVPADRPTRGTYRMLTPLEMERAMGWPDDWTAAPGLSDSARKHLIGNGMAAPCVEAIARFIHTTS